MLQLAVADPVAAPLGTSAVQVVSSVPVTAAPWYAVSLTFNGMVVHATGPRYESSSSLTTADTVADIVAPIADVLKNMTPVCWRSMSSLVTVSTPLVGYTM